MSAAVPSTPSAGGEKPSQADDVASRSKAADADATDDVRQFTKCRSQEEPVSRSKGLRHSINQSLSTSETQVERSARSASDAPSMAQISRSFNNPRLGGRQSTASRNARQLMPIVSGRYAAEVDDGAIARLARHSVGPTPGAAPPGNRFSRGSLKMHVGSENSALVAAALVRNSVGQRGSGTLDAAAHNAAQVQAGAEGGEAVTDTEGQLSRASIGCGRSAAGPTTVVRRGSLPSRIHNGISKNASQNVTSPQPSSFNALAGRAFSEPSVQRAPPEDVPSALRAFPSTAAGAEGAPRSSLRRSIRSAPSRSDHQSSGVFDVEGGVQRSAASTSMINGLMRNSVALFGRGSMVPEYGQNLNNMWQRYEQRRVNEKTVAMVDRVIEFLNVITTPRSLDLLNPHDWEAADKRAAARSMSARDVMAGGIGNFEDEDEDKPMGLAPMPKSAVKYAQALLFFFSSKAGVGFSYMWGWGLVVNRLGTYDDGSALWSAPSFFKVHQMSAGLTFGSCNRSTCLALNDQASVELVMYGRPLLGLDINFVMDYLQAAYEGEVKWEKPQPVKVTMADQHVKAEYETLDGSMIDCSVKAGVALVSTDLHKKLYGSALEPEDILFNPDLQPPQEFDALYRHLEQLAAESLI